MFCCFWKNKNKNCRAPTKDCGNSYGYMVSLVVNLFYHKGDLLTTPKQHKEERKMLENCKSNAIEHLENIDAQLLALDAMLELAAMGANNLANGDNFERVLNFIRHNLTELRAELDEATGIVLKAKAIA